MVVKENPVNLPTDGDDDKHTQCGESARTAIGNGSQSAVIG